MRKTKDGEGWDVVELTQGKGHQQRSELGNWNRNYFFPDYSFENRHLYELYEDNNLKIEFKSVNKNIATFSFSVKWEKFVGEMASGIISVDKNEKSRIIGYIVYGYDYDLRKKVVKNIDNNGIEKICVEISEWNKFTKLESSVKFSQTKTNISDIDKIDENQFCFKFYGLQEPVPDFENKPIKGFYVVMIVSFMSVSVYSCYLFGILKR